MKHILLQNTFQYRVLYACTRTEWNRGCSPHQTQVCNNVVAYSLIVGRIFPLLECFQAADSTIINKQKSDDEEVAPQVENKKKKEVV